MRLNFRPYGRKIAKFNTKFATIWTENNIYHLTAPCLVYNMAMYTVYGWCSQYGRCMFIHWPVREV